MTKYDVISIHPWTNGCNLNCPHCYVSKQQTSATKPAQFWIDLIKHCKTLSPQIALGASGEPFMDIPFVKEISQECKNQGVTLNITSNGLILEKLTDEELKRALQGVRMISLSYDKNKRPDKKAMFDYLELVSRIKKLTTAQVGCNLLIDEDMFLNNGKPFFTLVKMMFEIVKVDRVFALYPKNVKGPDILKYNNLYWALSIKYPHFYVDDCTKCIIEEDTYGEWKKPCHYGAMLSIDAEGKVSGCSFEKEKVALLEKPEDILHFKDFIFPKRNKCPFITR